MMQNNKALSEANRGNRTNRQQKNLATLAKLFEDGANIPRVQSPLLSGSQHTKVNRNIGGDFKVPLKGPQTQTKFVGLPVDLATARNLRATVLGFATQSFTTDWKKCFFAFRSEKSAIPYGLDASSPGPRSLILGIQAYVLKSLMFAVDQYSDDKSVYFGKRAPTPNAVQQENALVDAFVEVIWKAALPLNKQNSKENNSTGGGDFATGEKRQAIVALVGDEACFKTKGYFVADGFTEKLWLYTLYSKSDLKKFLRRNIHYFCCKKYPGAVALLYSVVLSRTCDVIKKDMGKKQDALLNENARSTQALVNLVLTGNAAPFLHNGVIRTDDKGKHLEHPLYGVRGRSEVGFLFFDKQEPENRRTQVGSMLKTPQFPVWLTKVNRTFGLLFCTSRDLVTDWKTERYFVLHYYNGHFTQQNETLLTLDTRTRADCLVNPDRQITIWDDEEEIEKKQPSLELCLATKWPGADIDWNGESPYY